MRLDPRKINFAKAYIKSGGDKVEASREIYPEKSHAMLLYHANKLLDDSQVQNLIQKFLLDAGIDVDLATSIKSTLKAERPHNISSGEYIMVPDNEARTKTQETVLKSFGVGERKHVLIQQMSMKMTGYPEHILRFIKENNREPTKEELVKLEQSKG